MLYELINPSDKYTFEAPTFELAAWAVLVLGQGAYGARPVEGEGPSVPVMLFNGSEDWIREHLGVDITAPGAMDRVMAEHGPSIADVLDSFVIGSVVDRDAYQTGLNLIDDPAKQKAWRERWLDRRRSSMNNIGARAEALAVRLREIQQTNAEA